MKSSTTKGMVINLTCGAELILFTQFYDKVSEIAKTVNALCTWLGTPPGFTILFWTINAERKITADEWPTKTTVNGGWAVPSSKQIVVYRYEEWERVLIHETIHALGWDWEMPSKPLPCWGFDDNDVVAPHLFEAWTELYAEWLYCGWFNIPWEQQRKWQTMQALQILARAKHTQNWKENTNVFAYYVLKAALAPYIELLWVTGNGTNAEERFKILCGLVTPNLTKLQAEAEHVMPKDISLRMTVKK